MYSGIFSWSFFKVDPAPVVSSVSIEQGLYYQERCYHLGPRFRPGNSNKKIAAIDSEIETFIHFEPHFIKEHEASY